MIYNDRVTLIFEKRPTDELLDKVEKKKELPRPLYAQCYVQL